MKSPKEDLLVQTSVRRHPIENPLVQFSVLSFAIMVILAIVLSVISTTRLNRDFEILKEQAAATAAGAPAPEALSIDYLDNELNLLRWIVYVSVGGGFAILYAGLIWVVWWGWRALGLAWQDRGRLRQPELAQDGAVGVLDLRHARRHDVDGSFVRDFGAEAYSTRTERHRNEPGHLSVQVQAGPLRQRGESGDKQDHSRGDQNDYEPALAFGHRVGSVVLMDSVSDCGGNLDTVSEDRLIWQRLVRSIT